MNRFIHLILLVILNQALLAQSDSALLRDLAEENKQTVEALALYPADARRAILESSKYPEVLVKLNSVRLKTSAAFREQIEDFPRETQELVYDIVRYPSLLQTLASKTSSSHELNTAVEQLPSKQRDAAIDFALEHKRVLQNIQDLQNTAQSATNEIIRPYPNLAQTAFQRLIGLPEVLELLNKDLRFTVLVGDLYRENPEMVIHKTDSLNLAVARNHADELEDWKKRIESDPEAQTELKQAVAEYNEEIGYDDQSYDYDREPVTRIVYAYPWWFGYPWWYDYPYWQPYPYWYDWGYYPQPGIVIVYMPSWRFMHWYFDRPYHHYHYSHLSAHFVDHYYGHRRSGTTISGAVGDWHDRNRSVISEDWMKDKRQLPERMKEYGKFEGSREVYNARNPNKQVSQEEYLKKNSKKYPELETSKRKAEVEVEREKEKTREKQADWVPRKEPVKATEPVRVPKTEPVRKPKTETVPERKPAQPVVVPKTERPKEEAKDYHQQKWEESKRIEVKRERPVQAPTPKTTTAPKTVPTKARKTGSGKD